MFMMSKLVVTLLVSLYTLLPVIRDNILLLTPFNLFCTFSVSVHDSHPYVIKEHTATRHSIESNLESGSYVW